MKKILGFKVIFNLALFIMLISGIVFTIGFGSSLYLARQEVTKETDEKVQRDIDYVQGYIDGQMQRIEDAAFSLASRNFGNTVRKEDGTASVDIDLMTFVRPTPEECYIYMEQFMEANPIVFGVALGFEPYVYPDVVSKYGFTPYVTRRGEGYTRMDMGQQVDCRSWEWYKEAANNNAGYWSNPFRDISTGKVIASFNLPVHGYGGRLVGVLAIVIDTEAFGKKCSEVAPYPNAQVTLADRNFNFVCHPDTSFLLRNVMEVGQYDNFEADDSMKIKMLAGESGSYSVNEGKENEALFYFSPLERAGWMITVECPKSEVYGGVERMKKNTTIIAILSILIMIISFIWLFRSLQKVTLSKAGIESELKIASAIQMGMIPKLYPAFPNRKELDVCGFLKPAKSVGGDLYDYFIRDEKFYFCIGDVSGKGVPASLFMAVIRSLFRNVSLHEDDPSAIADALNTGLAEGNEMNMFCTMFIGVLDLKSGHLDYCNAGHNAPIIRRLVDGRVDVHYATPKTNLAIGVFEGFPFEKEETILKPGEALFLYTDGVTEAENIEKQLFGEDKTLQALADARSHNVRTSQDFILSVYGSIESHTLGADQSDDITMLVVEYKGQ